MRCIECEEIELARVRDQRPTQTLPIPYQALDGFPAGRSPSHLTRRRLMQWGVAGCGVGLRAPRSSAGSRSGSRSPRRPTRPEKKCVVLLYLAGGNDGLNIVLPERRSRLLAPTSTRGRTSIAARAPTPAAASARGAARPGGERAGVRQRRSCPGADNNGGTAGFDTLYGDGTGGPGSDLAVMPAVDAKKYTLSHFDNSDLWFEASADLNNKTGWLAAGSTATADPNNPLQAVSLDTALSKAIRTTTMPVSRDQLAADDGLQADRQPAAERVQQHDRLWNEEVNNLAKVAAGAGNDYLARSRATYGLTYTTAQLAGGAYAPPAGTYPTTARRPDPDDALQAPADGRAHDRRARHADHHDPLGRLRHPHQPAHRPGHAVQGALARARRVPGRPQDPRDRPRVVHARVLRVRPAREGDARPGATVDDAGTDHGAGGLMFALGHDGQGRLRGRLAGLHPVQARARRARPATSTRATCRSRPTSVRST